VNPTTTVQLCDSHVHALQQDDKNSILEGEKYFENKHAKRLDMQGVKLTTQNSHQPPSKSSYNQTFLLFF
jgi:putative heme iron utilization protein